MNGGVVRSLLMDGELVADGVNARCVRSVCLLRTSNRKVADEQSESRRRAIRKLRTSDYQHSDGVGERNKKEDVPTLTHPPLSNPVYIINNCAR